MQTLRGPLFVLLAWWVSKEAVQSSLLAAPLDLHDDHLRRNAYRLMGMRTHSSVGAERYRMAIAGRLVQAHTAKLPWMVTRQGTIGAAAKTLELAVLIEDRTT
jgi:hypothetical protein